VQRLRDDKIASKLGNGLTKMDIYHRWTGYLKELSGIIKPAVQTGPQSSITWTADVDSTIVRMRTDGDSFAKIASELGNGLKDSDIKNRWTRHLKDKEKDIIIRLIIIISLMLDGMVSIQIMDNSHHYNYLGHCTSSCPIFVSSSD
jgi:hypothetical protein